MKTAPEKPEYDLVAIGKILRRGPQYLAYLIKYGGVTPHLALKLSYHTGISVSHLIHRRPKPGGGKARRTQSGRPRQRPAAPKK